MVMSLVGYGWTPVGWLMPRGLTKEVSTYHGVDSAKGRVIGGGRDHEVVLTVVTTPAANLRDLHHRIEAEASAHAWRAAGPLSLPVQPDLT
jgi:hypothetical protein